MAASVNNILFILEGEFPETGFVDSLIRNFDIGVERYILRENIYQLFQKVEECSYSDDLDIVDFRTILKQSKQHSDDEFKILENNFTYIYLFLDLDYHADIGVENNKNMILRNMLKYFNNETENGKIYINYPMVESIRDCCFPCKITDVSRNILVSESGDYKRISSERGNCTSYNKYKRTDCVKLISLNLLRANLFINQSSLVPTWEEYESTLKQENILECQLNNICNNNKIEVVNTSIFMIYEYFGDKILQEIKLD